MKRIEFIRPTLELVPLEDGIIDNYYCKLKVTPLERGYGMTLGNSLRRVLLSSLPGAAAVAVQIDGVSHEFCAVDGIREDVTEIILNIKNIIFTINADKNESGDYGDQDKTFEVRLTTNLPSIEAQVKAGVKEEDLVYSKVVTASMIDLTSTEDIKVVNGDQAICTLSAGASLNMVLLVRNGVGYVSATENKVFCKDVHSRANGFLPIDSIFTPVERCKYEVSKTRYLDNFDCDQLILEVWTDGSVVATNAVALAAKFLYEHFAVISNLNVLIQEKEYLVQQEEKSTNTKLDCKIEDLNLSVRSYNCLKRANINTVGELTQKTEEEMMKVRNLGRKSLKEVVQKLREIGLDLKNSTSLFDDDDEDFEDEDTSSDDEN
ncbi:MAG: DNA-directed RNA polymerase subunit alpha [Bacilli bacterium]|jgi:DNA-directed RNA polymerase subunit alpha|nr:DNA-directed RNA polymerase subunit alpha [Bacilli bacterium]